MALKDGDVVRFEYTLWVKGEKKPLETSREELAKERGIHRADKAYKPLTVTLGAQQIIPGLESHIRSHGTKGKAVTAELAAEDAYGKRDASKIQDVPMAQFRKQGVKPEPGLVLNMGGQRAVITRVAGGRVRVDTNHDLAGKDLVYEYEIVDIVTEPKEKVAAVMGNMFPQPQPDYTFEDSTITFEVPSPFRFDQNWPMQKLRLVAELRSAAGMETTVRLVETYEGRSVQSGEEE